MQSRGEREDVSPQKKVSNKRDLFRRKDALKWRKKDDCTNKRMICKCVKKNLHYFRLWLGARFNLEYPLYSSSLHITNGSNFIGSHILCIFSFLPDPKGIIADASSQQEHHKYCNNVRYRLLYQ